MREAERVRESAGNKAEQKNAGVSETGSINKYSIKCGKKKQS